MPTLKQEFIKFDDPNGRVYPNAQMFFYEAGTTTPKNTFTAPDLANTNPWPLPADGGGYFPVIFLEAGGYKVIVKDETGVIRFERDNLNLAETTVLTTGALYFNTLIDAKLGISINGETLLLEIGQIVRTAGKNFVDDGEGAEWTVVAAGTGAADDYNYADIDSGGVQLKRLFNQLYTTANLSDLPSPTTARANISVYSIAEVDAGFIADAADTVSESNMQTDSVGTDSIIDLNVTTPKIADLNVTAPKLATDTAMRDWVLARTAAASVGAVGTYATLSTTDNGVYSPGSTLAGSSLDYAGATYDTGAGVLSFIVSTSPAGTWRCMGYASGGGGAPSSDRAITTWLRIS